jgi:hypothetical protein
MFPIESRDKADPGYGRCCIPWNETGRGLFEEVVRLAEGYGALGLRQHFREHHRNQFVTAVVRLFMERQDDWRTTVREAAERVRQSIRDEKDREVRERAYKKWEEAGRPPGDGVSFWLAAEQEYLEEQWSSLLKTIAKGV